MIADRRYIRVLMIAAMFFVTVGIVSMLATAAAGRTAILYAITFGSMVVSAVLMHIAGRRRRRYLEDIAEIERIALEVDVLDRLTEEGSLSHQRFLELTGGLAAARREILSLPNWRRDRARIVRAPLARCDSALQAIFDRKDLQPRVQAVAR